MNQAFYRIISIFFDRYFRNISIKVIITNMSIDASSEQSAGAKSTQGIIKEQKSQLTSPYAFKDIDLSIFSDTVDTKEISKSVELMLGQSYLYIYRKDITDAENPHANVQIGRLEIDDSSNMSNFIPDADISLVSETFYILKDIPFFNYAKERFNISEPNEEMLKKAKELAQKSNEKAEKQQQAIDEIKHLSEENSRKEKRKVLNIEDDNIVGSVAQGEMGFLENNTKRYLETLGAGPCIIVTAYNPDKKIVAMSHIDALTDEKSTLTDMFRIAGKSEIRVFGGDISSINQMVSIKQILSENNATVLDWDILNSSKSIILDSETGEVFDVSKAKQRKDATKQDSMTMNLRGLMGKQNAKTKVF